MITTVIPTFERHVLLRRAIESVLMQNIPGQEVHVHDNASTDETESVVNEYRIKDSRVKYFKNSENIGAQKNVFKGIECVKTRYYSILSDDDFLLEGFYENALKAFSDHPRSQFVCAKTLTVDLINKKVQFRNKEWIAGFYMPSVEISRKMSRSHFVTTSVVFDRLIQAKLGLFDPSGSDSLYMTMAAGMIPFTVIDVYGAAITLHSRAYSIIGEGINKEKSDLLYNYMSKSLNNVAVSDLPDYQKVYLTMAVVDAYHKIFDAKRLRGLVLDDPSEIINDLFLLPNFINNRGLVVKLYQATPSWTKPLVRFLYLQINRLNRARERYRDDNGWNKIPEQTLAMLNSSSTDVSRFVFTPGDKK